MEHVGKGGAEFGADLEMGAALREGAIHRNTYVFECFDKDGNLKWREEVKNLVTTEGLNDTLDKYFKGSAYTAAWYVGLVDNTGFTAYAAGDTAAQINLGNGWNESSAYSEANRQTLTLGTPSGGSVNNSASKASFSINATVTIRGGFIISNNTKGGTTGVLYAEADFGAARSAVNGDTLNVTATLTQTSA